MHRRYVKGWIDYFFYLLGVCQVHINQFLLGNGMVILVNEEKCFQMYLQCIMCIGTASKPTKRKIFDVMSVSPEETLIIKMTPDRKNLQYAVQYVENSIPMTDLFSTILYEVKNNKEKTRRTIVYSFARCKTNVPYYGGCSSCI